MNAELSSCGAQSLRTPKGGQPTGLLFAIAMCARLIWSGHAIGQSYPERPIRFVIPYAAGGTTDLLARSIAHKLSDAMGQSVVPDNRPGAGGNIGAEIVAKSPPDGHTILMGVVSPLAINISLYGTKMKFNPEKDFTPITLVAKVPLVLSVHPSLPAKNLRELIALAKAQPGKLSYGSSGTGGSPHLIGEMLKSAARIDMLHVPFKGGAPAMVALLSGQIEVFIGAVPTLVPMVKAGRIRAIGVSSAKRSPALPDVPSIAEGGLPGFDATSWYGIVAPAGLTKPILTRLHSELVRILKSPEIRERLVAEGADVETMTPEEFGAFIRAEVPKWSRVVKSSKAQLD